MNRRLVVFDWNGTILSDTKASWQAGNACLSFYGAAPISLDKYRETFNFPIMHFYKLNGLAVDDVLAKKDAANVVFQSAYDRLAAGARTRRGARALLEWLAGREGVDCIILSNYRTEKIQSHLKRLKIEKYFKHVSAFGCEGTTILQTVNKQERLAEYMKAQGYKPEDTVVIGDTTEEINITKCHNLTSISITDGYISRARLKAAKPDYMVDSLDEVIGILKSLWRL